jgi:anthranilate synthase component 1
MARCGIAYEFIDLLEIRSNSTFSETPPFDDPRRRFFMFMDGFNEFFAKTRSANVIPVVETIPADLLTPLAVYLKLSAGADDSFLLESVEGGEALARYSFIGARPETVVSGGDDRVTIRKGDRTENVGVPMMHFLKRHFSEYRVYNEPGLPSFSGGAIGFLGFPCADWFEKSLKQPRDATGDSAFMFFRSIVAFDHAKQLIIIVTLVFTGDAANDDGLRDLYENAVSVNNRTRSILENAALELPDSSRGEKTPTVSSNWGREEFESAVVEIKEAIAAGECYQVVLSQCFSRPTAASPVAIYRAIRSVNPSPYMFLLKMGEKSIIGASPEMLVRCRGRKLEYRPIAGTRPRGKTPDEDAALGEEMRRDKKEVAEHLMLVDLGRNDLGRVAEFGSIRVEGLMTVEKYSHVQHLVSYLYADLRAGLDPFDALAACFPAGTVSGAPKVRAIEMIREMEPTARGVYAGAVGYFDYGGNMDTCIAIRTLVFEDGVARIQAGAGIVADSVPAAEYQETVNKAAALLKAIDIAEEQFS